MAHPIPISATVPSAALRAGSDRRYNRWLHRFAWLTAGATLFLICSGGMVTSKGVGLAVPDWPTTFGYNMFLFPISKWVGGIFFEHIHRLIASTVGFLTIILAVWIWRTDNRRWMRILGWSALGAVIVQGVLGGLRVTLLKDEIGVFHACLAQGFLGMLVVIALGTSELWERFFPPDFSTETARRLARAAIFTTTIIYAQLALGATMRHEHRDLAILDFPTAYGKILPEITPEKLSAINKWREARALSEVTPFHIWLQVAHRFLAVVIAAGVIACFFFSRVARGIPTAVVRASTVWLLLLVCQITLGAWTIWSNKAADIATAHVAAGATMLALGVGIAAMSLRLLHSDDSRVSPREYLVSEKVHAS